jgi:pimeloyl-ACP methyl ester carboxylesterase
MTTLVLLPGMDGTGDLFRPIIEEFGSSLRTVVVAYPSTDALGYTALEQVALRQLPASPFVLLGESFSGPIAIALAAAGPPNLQALILSCSFASSPRPLAARASPALSLPLPFPPSQALAAALLGSFSTPQLRATFKQTLKRVAPRVLRQRLAEALRTDVRAKLSQVKVPVLYLQASSDWVVPESAWTGVKGALPSAQLKVVPGPHMLLQANPGASAKAILEFIASVSNAA